MDLTEPTPSAGNLAGPTLGFVVEALQRGRAAEPLAWHNTEHLPLLVFEAFSATEHMDTLDEGEHKYACAIAERDGSAQLDAIATRAELAADGSWTLRGAKCFVPGAADVDVLLVVARADDGLGVFTVARDAPGVTITPLPTIGLDDQCDVALDAAPATLLAARAEDALAVVIGRAVIVLCADAVGAAVAALDHTVEHVTTREQWGGPIGTFQAVQHRCADMLIDVTTARDAVYDAAGTVDRGEDAILAASRAKAFAIDACRRVTAAAHQLHGGEGIYADQPVHLWYRRVKAIEPMYGSPDFHRARVAAALLDD
jgi:alkylation response protein AidB-like acyl-CoA dehydrogenase